LLSLADFRAATFSLSVTRDEVGLEDEFELFMQLLGTYFNLLRCSCWPAPPDLTSSGYQHRHLYRAAGIHAKTPATTEVIVLNVDYRIHKDAPADPVRVSDK
jgi:hypothetical protein